MVERAEMVERAGMEDTDTSRDTRSDTHMMIDRRKLLLPKMNERVRTKTVTMGMNRCR